MTLIYGLCCVNNFLNTTQNVRCRIINRKTYTKEKAIDTIIKNLEDLVILMNYNIEHNIKSFRISSDIFPRYTDKLIIRGYEISDFNKELRIIGKMAKDNDIRLSFHPAQYTVLSNCVDKDILKSSIDDIEYHCEMLERMGISSKYGVCNIHGGGLYMSSCNKGLTRKEAKNKVFETWSYHFKNNLSSTARKYLTIENDEKSFNLDDCLKISSMCGVPVVFDTFHEECYVHSHPDEIHVPVEENLERLVKTWTSRKKSPMSHVSNQKKGSKVGTHSDFIERLPSILTTYALKCPDGKLWVDVEAKAKEEAIFDLLKKHKH